MVITHAAFVRFRYILDKPSKHFVIPAKAGIHSKIASAEGGFMFFCTWLKCYVIRNYKLAVRSV